MTALALVGALLVARHAARESGQACWGDLVPAFYTPSPGDLAQLPVIAAHGSKSRTGVVRLGDLEIHYVPIYHRFGDTDEIGWKSAVVIDPSSCSERAIELDLEAGDSMSGYPIRLLHDPARDVFIAASGRAALAAFQRCPAPGLKYDWAGLAPALAFDAASALALLTGLVKRARARPAAALLGISLLLSVLGALLGLHA